MPQVYAPPTQNALLKLANSLDGELYWDDLMRTLYATDASVYREMPLAVAYPKGEEDLRRLIAFARDRQAPLIPRAAGTSLAGQCVGSGIVVDISRHFTRILDFNPDEGWVRVQPGVVRDELNAFLEPHGFFFSPITSTANRAMIGGMVGNNSCGTTSIVYGSTREHVLELKTLLSDGSTATFAATSPAAFEAKTKEKGLEGELYRHIRKALSQPANQDNIRREFPKESIHRRNTGYALDYLLESAIFSEKEADFDFCKLLCGSEGTLAFTTEIKLHVDPLPPPKDVVVAAHFETVRECLLATQFAMTHQPTACEMMDKIILDCTKENLQYSQQRGFIEGDPKGVLLVEFRGETREECKAHAEALVRDFLELGMGYAHPVIHGPATKGLWGLRSAGLGLLANIPGDEKAVACIEDTAVALEDLADYIAEFEAKMDEFGQRVVYYAHAGAGELHLRPILNLKTEEGVADFYKISEATARLVKKYRGSLSGEHGDGRVRAAFLPIVVGEDNYELFREIKKTWDPRGIFNPGKIVDAEPMDTSLRYEPAAEIPEIETLMDFSETGGMLRMAEKCNGSGDCRKLALSGGTMCPSYQATRHEKDTTRARANVLREYLSKKNQPNPFDHPEIKEVLDLCLSCKGCTSECPSNVDMASMKAEVLHQHHQVHGIPLRSRAFARISMLNQLGSRFPALTNWTLRGKVTGGLLKRILGVAPERELPGLQRTTLRRWLDRNLSKPKGEPIGQLYLFCDEFTNFNDTDIGIQAVELLTRLGYEVLAPKHPESGRAAISKGLLEHARSCAQENVAVFAPLVSADTPLVGIEPSAILGFRDEYPRLVVQEGRAAAKALSAHCLTIEEFLSREAAAGRISSASFKKDARQVLLHGHCHQKALSKLSHTQRILSLPENYSVEVIPSGCCGMAGSFGYEAEHYGLSMQIGEMVLFPAVRKAAAETLLAAAGTSCRHQIKDGTGRKARHPVSILREALAE